MFTGIIHHIGKIVQIATKAKSVRIAIESHFDELIAGESIAVNGACLTVTEINEKTFYVDVSPETLSLTNLRNLRMGDAVNLERSLHLNDRIGGHFVYGHVDKTCVFVGKNPVDEFWNFVFSGLSTEDLPYFVNKGSVAVNGVSLTINRVDKDSFSVMIIPHTYVHTTLGLLESGQLVNIEFDWLTRVVVNRMQLLTKNNYVASS